MELANFVKWKTVEHANEIAMLNNDEDYAEHVKKRYEVSFAFYAAALFILSVSDAFKGKTIEEANTIMNNMSDEDFIKMTNKIENEFGNKFEKILSILGIKESDFGTICD